jgi:hypothetical protein
MTYLSSLGSHDRQFRGHTHCPWLPIRGTNNDEVGLYEQADLEAEERTKDRNYRKLGWLGNKYGQRRHVCVYKGAYYGNFQRIVLMRRHTGIVRGDLLIVPKSMYMHRQNLCRLFDTSCGIPMCPGHRRQKSDYLDTCYVLGLHGVPVVVGLLAGLWVMLALIWAPLVVGVADEGTGPSHSKTPSRLVRNSSTAELVLYSASADRHT